MFSFFSKKSISLSNETTPPQIHYLVIKCAHYKLRDFSKTRLFLLNTFDDRGIVNLDS